MLIQQKQVGDWNPDLVQLRGRRTRLLSFLYVLIGPVFSAGFWLHTCSSDSVEEQHVYKLQCFQEMEQNAEVRTVIMHTAITQSRTLVGQGININTIMHVYTHG